MADVQNDYVTDMSDYYAFGLKNVDDGNESNTLRLVFFV